MVRKRLKNNRKSPKTKTSAFRRALPRRGKDILSAASIVSEKNGSMQKEKETVEAAKFDTTPKVTSVTIPQEVSFRLPFRYADNRIMLLPRDPWWLYTYWDISQSKIDEVINSILLEERQNLKWTLRVYDISDIKEFKGNNAHSYFDIEIHFEANNWYVNVNQPERSWCIEIGFKNSSGKFFPIARSNTVKTPSFGISHLIDEEWVLPDEDYYKMLGVFDLGKSSLQMKKRFEEFIRHQISSPLASWGVSSLFSERPQLKEKFFLEVWTELILYGRTEADADVAVEGRKITLRPDGTFALRYSLPEGDFKFEVTGTSKNKKHKITKIPAVKRFNKGTK